MPDITRSAEFSADGAYRYRLTREWAEGGRATFVMLNPSTADAQKDDPTIRRCIGFARSWGLGGLTVVNLYGFRATKPADLWTAADPIGPENDRHLREVAMSGSPLIAAWGAHAESSRVDQVLSLPGFGGIACLEVTKNGAPRHPLYLRKGLMPMVWNSAASAAV